MKSFLRILRFIAPYKGYAWLNVLCNVLAVLFSLVSITMIIPFLGILIGTTDPVYEIPEFRLSASYFKEFLYYKITSIVQEKGNMEALGFVCVLVAVSFFFRNLFRYLALYFLTPLRNGVVRDIRAQLHTKVLHLPIAYFTEKRKGDVMARLTNDVKEVEQSIISSLEMTVRDPLTIIAFTLALFSMSPQLTMFVFMVFPVAGFIIGKIGRSLKRTSTKAQDKLADILALIEENISGLNIIKSFNAEKRIDRKFREENQNYYRISNRMFRKRYLSSPTSEMLSMTVLVTVMWFGGKLVLKDGSLTPDVFLGYITLFSQMIPPAKSLTTAFYNIQKGNAAADRINEVIIENNPIVDPEKPKAYTGLGKEISFKNVTFDYGDGPVLKNINLSIPKGKTYALVGQSGSGKTSLMNLVPRFYDVTEGEVLLDDIRLRDLNLSDIRKHIGMVSQDSILFNDTVARNIALGKEEASMEEVVEAAKIANAHEFITQLPDGYDTNIGDGGGRLSGGQKQRLAIARAVLINPEILLLDEATSALDTESERLVQEALEKLLKGRTSLVIAHRLSTIQHADKIIVMQDGKVIETGTHLELAAKDGVYKKLLDMQSFE